MARARRNRRRAKSPSRASRRGRSVSARFCISRRNAARFHLRRDYQSSFACLDFPGRHTLYPFEIATRIGCSRRHVMELIAEGHLCAMDISCRNTGTSRQTVRIPIDSYRKFLLDRLI